VRLVEPVELDALLPACVAMFTEEVGVSPLRAGEAESYRQRIAELIRQARAYAIFDAGEVVFKAEVGAIGGGVCQVQGVWVKPELRGRGMAAPALAAVIEEARHTFAPVVSLYANSFNELALRVYRRLGMHQVATFATVLW
jgi:predicted GNAT family acetyltransferase